MLSALREADVVACEDTRRTRVLLERYGVAAKLVSYHEHNEQRRAAELVSRMRSGAVVALVSDAGMPLVSDPGYVLVRACVAAGLPVEVFPGPSAAVTALVASGLPADEWRFAGFLPRKKGERQGPVGAGRDARGVRVAAAAAGDVGAARLAVARARSGRLPRAHEGPRRGRPRDGGRARLALRGRAAQGGGRAGAGAVRRGLLVSRGGARGAAGLVDAGARPRKAASIVASLTGASANELYRALTEDPTP